MSKADSILKKAKVEKASKTGNAKEKKMYPSTKETLKLVDGILDKTEKVTNLNSELAVEHARVQELVAEKREVDVPVGDYQQTYHLESSDGRTIRCTFTNKFSKVPDNQVDDLKEACKEHNLTYEELFAESEVLQMKADILGDKKNVELLFKKLGEKLFYEMFEYITTVKPGAEFDRKQFGFDTEARDELLTFTKQAKASIVTK